MLDYMHFNVQYLCMSIFTIEEKYGSSELWNLCGITLQSFEVITLLHSGACHLRSLDFTATF